MTMNVLAIDTGGIQVKILFNGKKTRRLIGNFPPDRR